MKKILITIGIVLLIIIGAVIFFVKNNRVPAMYESNSIEIVTDSEVVAATKELPLTVIAPLDKEQATSDTIVVRGKTAPQANVFVNEHELTADAIGAFSVTLNLEQGDNYIIIVANDNEGSFVEKELVVTL